MTKVYGVFYGVKCLYVGQTTQSLSQRKSEHKTKQHIFKDYPWDQLQWLVLKEPKNWEQHFIEQLQPQLNKNLLPRYREKSKTKKCYFCRGQLVKYSRGWACPICDG